MSTDWANHPPANFLKSYHQTFTRTVTILRYLSTNGLRLLIQFYYAKTPMFWIPKGWVPNYAAFLLAFPRAPRGSVSVQMWGIACATVVQMVFAAVAAALILLRREKGRQGVEMSAGEGSSSQKETKKEL